MGRAGSHCPNVHADETEAKASQQVGGRLGTQLSGLLTLCSLGKWRHECWLAKQSHLATGVSFRCAAHTHGGSLSCVGAVFVPSQLRQGSGEAGLAPSSPSLPVCALVS